jgi:hypothetical protein
LDPGSHESVGDVVLGDIDWTVACICAVYLLEEAFESATELHGIGGQRYCVPIDPRVRVVYDRSGPSVALGDDTHWGKTEPREVPDAAVG